MNIAMHKAYCLVLLLLDWIQGIVVSGNGLYMSVVNYEYFSLSPLILGISQVWWLVSLAVAQSCIQNLKSLFGVLTLQYVLLWQFLDWIPLVNFMTGWVWKNMYRTWFFYCCPQITSNYLQLITSKSHCLRTKNIF